MIHDVLICQWQVQNFFEEGEQDKNLFSKKQWQKVFFEEITKIKFFEI